MAVLPIITFKAMSMAEATVAKIQVKLRRFIWFSLNMSFKLGYPANLYS